MMKDNLGFGVMIGVLSGNKETVQTVTTALGKTISVVQIDKEENELKFHFTDGSAIRLFDDGQSCCEHRHMHTDDDLSYYTDTILEDIELLDGPSEDNDYEVKDSQFLVITTSKGQFTIVNYNEHNGYYGGFWIVARAR